MTQGLERFVSAQERAYATALAEVRRGRKESHWMWYVFPQMLGLGGSTTARDYGIRSLDEARAYFAHPVLGARLEEIARAALDADARTAGDIFGGDDVKLRSCATLFALVAEKDSVFHRVLDRYFNGEPDPRTLQLLEKLQRAGPSGG